MPIFYQNLEGSRLQTHFYALRLPNASRGNWKHFKSFMCDGNGCYDKNFVHSSCGHGPISRMGRTLQHHQHPLNPALVATHL